MDKDIDKVLKRKSLLKKLDDGGILFSQF